MERDPFPRASDPVTPGWNFVSIGGAGEHVSLEGVNPWDFTWRALHKWPITVAHPNYPLERHHMDVYEIREGGRVVTFAAGEFSNGVWGFYLPEQPSTASSRAEDPLWNKLVRRSK